MSIIQAGNLHLESTGNNRIQYLGANTIGIYGNAIVIPTGNTTSRPAAANGMLRYNTQSNKFEGYANGAWGDIGGGSELIDDTTTNSNAYYCVFANTATPGYLTFSFVSSTKAYFNPSTGQFNATIFNTLSDKTKKADIKPIEDALNKVDAIGGYTFKWIDNWQPSAGVIAQEVKEVLPEVVSDDMSVNYAGIIGLLVQAIKELKAEVEILKGK